MDGSEAWDYDIDDDELCQLCEQVFIRKKEDEDQ